jgi:hypothetical protein
MRRLWRRTSRSRLFLVVAPVSVITLAASSPTYPAVSRGHVVRSASAVAAARGVSTASIDCSKETATQVASQFQLTDEVAQVFCGDFVGPGSQAMVVAFTPGTCGINGWAVFSFRGGTWQLVGSPHSGWTIALAAVGSDIRETAPVPTGRFECPTSGRARSRIWHWDGARLVAGPWKEAPVRRAAFRTPSGNIECGLADVRTLAVAECWTFKPPQKVRLYPGGRLTICRGSEARCKLANVGEAPTLGYGRRITVGRFHCLSRRSGVRCTVIRSGKGFLINRAGVKRVGP